jgi:hypothetical protein
MQQHSPNPSYACPFKYCQHISQINNCPPPSCGNVNRKAYRFTFEDINNVNNFLPVAIINPQRFTPSNSPDSMLCSSYGLSLYDTFDHAKQRLTSLAKTISKTGYNRVGTHVAEGDIDINDGVASEIGRDGHFTLHESNTADLSNKFSVIQKII